MREKGAALIRRQADESLVGYDGSRSAAANRIDALAARAESAEADLARCKRALESSRAQQEADRQQAAAVAADRDRLESLVFQLMAGNYQLRRNWERASALLRLLSPEQVAALRRERDGEPTT